MPDLHSPAASDMMVRLSQSLAYATREVLSTVGKLEMVLWSQFSGLCICQGLIPPKDAYQCLTVPKLHVGSCLYYLILLCLFLSKQRCFKRIRREFCILFNGIYPVIVYPSFQVLAGGVSDEIGLGWYTMQFVLCLARVEQGISH